MWMRIFFLLLLAFSGMYAKKFPVKGQHQLTLEIYGLRNDKGHVLASVFKGADGFPDKPEKAFRKLRLSIVQQKAVIVLNDLPAGEYAIAILHDENDDEKLNTNWVGLPKEGFGFSNNAMGMFGPPSYNRARFAVQPGDNRHTIKARYF